MTDDPTTTDDLRSLQVTNAQLEAMDEAELLERIRLASQRRHHHERCAEIAKRLIRRYHRAYAARRYRPAAEADPEKENAR